MVIIALSGKRNSGKTTAANILMSNGFIKLSFATPLKNICGELLGFNHEQLYETKDIIDVRYNKTPRECMLKLARYLNNDFNEFVYGEKNNIFVRIMENKIDKLLNDNKNCNIVIDDCRLIDEFEMLKNKNALFINISRENKQNNNKYDILIDNDITEKNNLSFDILLENNNTEKELNDKLINIIYK